MHKFYTFEHRLSWFYTCVNRKERKNPKKYGANAPQLHPIRCSIDFCVMLCNEQGKNPKNTAQTLHSCAISLFVIADGFEMLFFHFFCSTEQSKQCSISGSYKCYLLRI